MELALRSELRRRGLHYRINLQKLPGRPDIVFTRYKVVVFCDGDFWHGRELNKQLARLARGHNPTYWQTKIMRNVGRDRYQTEALEGVGWTVLRFWESDLRHDLNGIVDQIVAVLENRVAVTQSHHHPRHRRHRGSIPGQHEMRDQIRSDPRE